MSEKNDKDALEWAEKISSAVRSRFTDEQIAEMLVKAKKLEKIAEKKYYERLENEKREKDTDNN